MPQTLDTPLNILENQTLHCKKTKPHPAHKSANVAWAQTQFAWTLSTVTCGR